MSQDSIVHDDEGAAPQTLPSDPSRRFWIGTTCAVGGAAGAALAVPFVSTFAPSEKAPSNIDNGHLVFHFQLLP